MVDVWDTADEARRIGTRAHTIEKMFAVEQHRLAPLPDEPFETGTLLRPADTPPLPTVTAYHQLLRLPPRTAEGNLKDGVKPQGTAPRTAPLFVKASVALGLQLLAAAIPQSVT